MAYKATANKAEMVQAKLVLAQLALARDRILIYLVKPPGHIPDTSIPLAC